MMLRSSSTPLLGSLLSSFSDSPNHNHHFESPHSTTTHHNHTKLSFQQYGFHNLNTTHSSFSSSSSSSSPISAPAAIRRAQSEGNLEGLVKNGSSSSDEICISDAPKKFPRKPNCSNLQTIQSFSFHSSIRFDEEEEEGEEYDEETEQFEENGTRVLNTNMTMDLKSNEGKVVDLDEEETEDVVSREMYLAKGLGVDGFDVDFCGGGGGGRGDFVAVGYGKDGGGDDNSGIGDHYERMVKENPGNSLFLRNYAQYLYQSREDLQGAEEYYSRAILADPKDGEILSQYAKVIWELHHDEERATSYFERAIHAAPQDSHVHAAYASFLWETED